MKNIKGQEMTHDHFSFPMDVPRFPIKCKVSLDSDIKLINPGDLVKLPHIVQVRGEITEETAGDFANSFHIAESSGQSVVPIVIDSYGGDIYALLSMIDIIEASSVPVATVVMGKAMSAGSVLLSCGNEGMRFASPSSTIMIHSAWQTGISGNADEVKVDAEELIRLNQKILEVLSLNCGHSKTYFHKLMSKKKNTDWYIGPKEAVKHNLVNHVRIPEFNIQISTKVNFK
jgi:ATP-dependent Clp protease protease subunit